MIKPLGTNIIVEVIPNETKTSGGIILTEKQVEESCTGMVVAVNELSYHPDGRQRQSLVEVGQVVLFAKRSGTKVIHAPQGKDWLAVPEDCLIYVVE